MLQEPWGVCRDLITAEGAGLCSSLPSVAVIKHGQECMGEERVCLVYKLLCNIKINQGRTLGGTQRQELKQKLWRNTAYFLDSPNLLNYLSNTAQIHLPRAGTAYRWLYPPNATIYQDNALDIPTGQSVPGNSSTEVSSF